MYSTKKIIMGLACIFIICFIVLAFLIVDYVKPKYETGMTESIDSINGLNGILESFPSVGEIKYVRRTQAGTVGIFFVGKILPEKIEEYCEIEGCITSPAKDYKQVWQDRLSLYKMENAFHISFGEEDFHIDGPQPSGDNRYRVSFLYIPSTQTFIGEVFFFR